MHMASYKEEYLKRAATLHAHTVQIFIQLNLLSYNQLMLLLQSAHHDLGRFFYGWHCKAFTVHLHCWLV